MLYLDASALVKLILDEPETAALRAAVEGRRLTASDLVLAEVPRAAGRARPGQLVTPVEQMLDAVVPLDRSLLRRAATVAPLALRTLDAIHVASALRLEDDLEAFVTYDRRQQEAAILLGLPVTAPA